MGGLRAGNEAEAMPILKGPSRPPASEPLSDEEIVSRVIAGEPALFELLMRRHDARLYRIARSIVRDESEAEDVMQQAYVNAYSHLSQFGGRARFSTWLGRITVHEALARVRRRRRRPEVEISSAEETAAGLHALQPDPEQQAAAGELRRVVERALDALPRASRTRVVVAVFGRLGLAAPAMEA